jgi:hypothetical protein
LEREYAAAHNELDTWVRDKAAAITPEQTAAWLAERGLARGDAEGAAGNIGAVPKRKFKLSETMAEIKTGRLWDNTKTRTPYTRSPDDCIASAKALVEREAAREKARE